MGQGLKRLAGVEKLGTTWVELYNLAADKVAVQSLFVSNIGGQANCVGNVDMSSGNDWNAVNQSFVININNTGEKTVTLDSTTTNVATVVTEINNQLKADIANMQGQLESDANSIRSMVAKTTNRTSLIEIADKVQNNITTISAKYDKEIAKLISNDLEIKKFITDEDTEGAEKRTDYLTNLMRDLAENTLKEYRVIEMLINKKLAGTTVGGIGSGKKKLLSTKKVTE